MSASTNSKKRKQPIEGAPAEQAGAGPSKRLNGKAAVPSTTSPLQTRINALQKALSASSDLNPLAELLDLLRDIAIVSRPSSLEQGVEAGVHNVEPAPLDAADASRALYRGLHIVARALRVLCDDGRVPVSSSDEEGRATGGEGVEQSGREVRRWLRERWNEAVGLFCALLGDEREDIRTTSLRLLLDLQKSASSSLSHKEPASSASTPATPTAQWSTTPWLALHLALVAGPPALSSFPSFSRGGTSVAQLARSSPVPQDIRALFADSFLESYDDVRFAFCRTVSGILSHPPPSAVGNDSLRSNALAVLLLLTAVPSTQADLNAFWVPELGAPPPKPVESGKKGKGKKAQQKQKVTEDGDSDEEDMQDWFSDSGDEGEKKDKVEVQSNGGTIGQRAKKAVTARRRKNPPMHEAIHHLPAQKAAFSSAWMALLLPKEKQGKVTSTQSKLVGGVLSLVETHEILVRLHAQVLPHLVRPTLLHDFLVDCLSVRGATALLALNGLFTLIVSHNLDYPSFYTRLYALLDASVLHVRHRARFLRLLDTFLGSTHLPAALVASFAKRLSRLALRASPAAIVAVVPFVWNLLKRHHTCLQMIHRDHEGDRLAVGPAGLEDPFDATEPDPLKTDALSSSLWELSSFGAAAAAASNSGAAFTHGGEAHYLASTTTLARILAVTFTKEKYDLEDFLDMTYGTLFDNETIKTLQPREASTYANGKPRKAPPIPALAYSLPEGRNGRKFEAFPVGPQDEEEEDGQEEQGGEEAVVEDASEQQSFAKSQAREGEDEEEREAREAMEELRRREKSGETFNGTVRPRKKVADAVTTLWAF